LDEIDELLRKICKSRKGVKRGIPSAAERADGSIVESFYLVAKNEGIAESVADELVVGMRQRVLRRRTSVTLLKRVGESDETVEYRREILPKTDSGWVAVIPTLPDKNDDQDISAWPSRLQYLASAARCYYAIGGNDVVAVFRNPTELHRFVAGLSKQNLDELVALAKQIVANSDHAYIMEWFNEDIEGDVSWPQAQALYFLALLDRLREEGVFDSVPEVKPIQFVDWNAVGG
jgi:hypothetical protein